MKLLDELKTVKLESPRTAQNVAKFYAKLNEVAKKLQAGGLLTPDSLALHYFIRGFTNQHQTSARVPRENRQPHSLHARHEARHSLLGIT
jgi:hypothetical protein